MPASDQKHGLTAALQRLLHKVRSWRQRRAARRSAQLHGLMHMSDRMLADIGVRRADVYAVASGLLPVEHITRTYGGGAPWTAEVHRLLPPASPRPGASAARDLGAAA